MGSYLFYFCKVVISDCYYHIISDHYDYIVVSDSYDQSKAKNLDNPDEMGKFQEAHKLPNLPQEEIINLNKPIPSKEVESVTKNLPTKKNPGPDSISGKFNQTFKEDLIPILFKLFQKLYRKEHFLTHSIRPA